MTARVSSPWATARSWPAQSKLVGAAYAPILAWGRRAQARPQEVLLLNPAARRLIADDSRVDYRSHNVFEPWPGRRPDVVKVANLLRRLYFTDNEISSPLTMILNTLDEGGHLLMVDNPRIKDMPPRGGLYQKREGRFVAVAYTENHPEIDDLVLLATI